MILRPLEDGVEIRIRAQPRASRTEIAGPYGDRAVRIRLTAPPVDGAANEELVELLATTLEVASSSVELTRGHGTRSKVARVAGVTVEEARGRLGL